MPYAEVNGHRIHFLDAQDLGYPVEDGKLPIIMSHGLGGSENYYMPILPQLVGHRCIAFTTYGSALSPSKGESITAEQLANDVVGLMDHLKFPKAIVVGHSMAGPIALTTAARYPDRTAGVVAVGPTNPATVTAEVFQGRIKTVLKEGMEPLANAIPQAATNARSTTLQRAIIREMLLKQDPKSYAAHCETIVGMKDPGFANIKTPVLILAGDEDRSASMEGCQSIHDQLGSQQKELKVMKGVGHWHCIESPEEVGKHIAAFAAGLSS